MPTCSAQLQILPRVTRRSLDLPKIRYGRTIDVHQAAALGGYEVSTIYMLLSEGLFPKSVARSRPLLFLRDLFVWERKNIQASRQAKRRVRPTKLGRATTTQNLLGPAASAEVGGVDEAR